MQEGIDVGVRAPVVEVKGDVVPGDHSTSLSSDFLEGGLHQGAETVTQHLAGEEVTTTEPPQYEKPIDVDNIDQLMKDILGKDSQVEESIIKPSSKTKQQKSWVWSGENIKNFLKSLWNRLFKR